MTTDEGMRAYEDILSVVASIDDKNMGRKMAVNQIAAFYP